MEQIILKLNKKCNLLLFLKAKLQLSNESMQENLIFCMHYCRLYIGDMVEHMWQSMALSGQYGYDCYVGKDQLGIYTSIAHIKLS